jgi:N-methylhydantoinase B
LASQRDPELVRQDVQNGYVSFTAAREQYGVVLQDGLEIDWEATRRRRAPQETPVLKK